jgi:Flp pilus assembly protein TadD
MKNYNEALSDFNKAIELAPNEALFYLERAKVFLAKGDKAAHNADIKKAKEMDKEERK